MALVFTTWQDWVDRAESEKRLQMYAPGDTEADHPKVEKAEKAAVGTMNSYLRKRGYQLPLDVDLPVEVKEHLISLGMDFLTLRAESKPDSIDRNAKNARAFFKDISLGYATLVDTDVLTPAGTGDTGMLHSKREVVFDFEDPTSEGGSRFPKL